MGVYLKLIDGLVAIYTFGKKYSLINMQYLQIKSFLWFTLCLALLVETTIVRAGSAPMFGDQSREVRSADARRRYRGRSYSRGRSSGRRYNVGQVVGGTVLAGGAAATGLGLQTGNSDLTNAGLTSVVAGGALKGLSSLLGKK